jgi:hypothetical protein
MNNQKVHGSLLYKCSKFKIKYFINFEFEFLNIFDFEFLNIFKLLYNCTN